MYKAAGFLAMLVGSWLAGWDALPARAAEDEPAQPYILILGIGQYQDKQIVARPNNEADAKALYDLFINKGHLGVDASHIKLLLGTPDAKRSSEPATRENIIKGFEWLTKSATKKDTAIVAIFAQGAPLGERMCYFATDSTFKNRAKDAVAAGDIEHALEKLKSQHFVVFLDANFRGFDAGKETAPDLVISGFAREFVGKDEGSPTTSRVVFVADTELKGSLDAGKHGAFAEVLLSGMSGKADKFGYEPDGLITVEELAKYVRKEMPERNRALGKTDKEKARKPAVLEGQSHDFVLDLNPDITVALQKRIASFQKIAKASDAKKDVLEEGEVLLKRMPALEAKQRLRKVYQQLADDKLTYVDFQKEREAIISSTKLTEAAALRYARLVMRSTELVRENYFKETNRGELIATGLRGLFKRLSETVPSAIETKLADAKKLNDTDLIQLLVDARQHLGQREDLDKGKDVTLSLRSMLAKMDMFSDYIDPETIENFTRDLTGRYTGIGVQIRTNDSKNMLQVVTPIWGSPAYKAKMYAGDIISQIIREEDSEGKPLATPEVTSTKGMTTEEAVKKILGKEGTKVKLLVERPGVEKPLEFELLRGKIELESVLGHKRASDDSWDYVIDPENRICYVRLTQFSRNTHSDLAKIVRDLTKVGIKGFILDLRFNPGGFLDSAVKISDMFVDDGIIVTIRPRVGAEVSYIGKSDGSYLTFPMVCLVNGGSASGSEIVAGCLQDHGRAVIIGSRSYGKGSVQQFFSLPNKGELKLTNATFWRPNGRNLNKASTSGKDEEDWGVMPNKGFDIKLPVKEANDLQEHMRNQEIIHKPGAAPAAAKTDFSDRQLDLALEYLRAKIRSTVKTENGKKAG